jgi:hypothetical protein
MKTGVAVSTGTSVSWSWRRRALVAVVIALENAAYFPASVVLDSALHPLTVDRDILVARAGGPWIGNMSDDVCLHRIASAECNRIFAVDILSASDQVAGDKDRYERDSSVCAIARHRFSPSVRRRVHRNTHPDGPNAIDGIGFSKRRPANSLQKSAPQRGPKAF